MPTVVTAVAVVLTAIAFIGLIAAIPLLAARSNPRPADQLAEMRRNEPATTSDDPGHLLGAAAGDDPGHLVRAAAPGCRASR